MNKVQCKISIRSRIHNVFYRKVELIEDYEFVILSLIDRAGGSIKFNDLGVLLGFATTNINDRNIRQDDAEGYLLDQFLDPLISYKLIEKEEGLITNLDWGKLALAKKEKYRFFSAQLSLPSFFDLELYKDEFFDFKSLGFDLKFENEKEITDAHFIEQGVDFEEEYNSSNKIEFWNSSKLEHGLFSVDLINETPFSFKENDVEVEAYIHNNELTILYKDTIQEKLFDVFSYAENSASFLHISLKCSLANFLDSTEIINSENITPFLDVVNWRDIVNDERVVWEEDLFSLILTDSNTVLSNLTSDNCDLDFLEKNIDIYQEFWDWVVVTKRVNNKYILETLSIYPWDISYLIEELAESEFESCLNEIIKIVINSSDDITLLIPRISNEYILSNINTISLDLNLFLYDKRDNFNQIVFNYLEYNWDWYYVISNIDLQIFIDNYNAVEKYIQSEKPLLLNRILYLKSLGSLDFKYDFISELVGGINATNDVKFNLQSCIVSDVNILQILDSNNLIYWGDNYAPGFEQNKNIEWGTDQLKEFIQFFNYQESIDFLSSSISCSLVISEFNHLNWNWEIISQNSSLISTAKFIEDNEFRLNFLKVAQFIGIELLFVHYDLIQNRILIEDKEEFSDIISTRFSLIQILEKERENSGDLLINDWDSVLSKTSTDVLNTVVNDYYSIIPKLHKVDVFLTLITKEFSVDFILKNKELCWDWECTTQNLIDDGLSNDVLESFTNKLYWPLLIESYYSEEDILFKNKLPEISVLLKSSNHFHRKTTWEAITRKYPKYDFNNVIDITIEDVDYNWDWDVISSTDKIDTKLTSLIKNKEHINWGLLSSNPILNELFNSRNKDLYESLNSGIIKINSYLNKFEDLWDFKKLSKLSAINWQANIIVNYRDKWDWEILSSDSSRLLSEKDKKSIKRNTYKYSDYRLEQFSNQIKWDIISNRRDLIISEVFVETHIDKGWDWGALSINPKFTPTVKFLSENSEKDWSWPNFSLSDWISSDYIIALPEKSWDWNVISKNKKINFNTAFLNILAVKNNVDWSAVIQSPSIEFNLDTITVFAKKNIIGFWNIVSNSSRLVINNELLGRFRLQWNWRSLIENNRVDINNIEVLEKYESSLSWETISKSSSFSPSLEVLENFKNKLNWTLLTSNLELSIDVLRQFKAYINWAVVSNNSNIEFNINLVSEFIDVLDLNILQFNPALSKDSFDFIESYLRKHTNARFIYKLNEQKSRWNNSIYHFTHITNAVNVINTMKILSRNMASKLSFSDAAGNVVNLRDTAHSYARFYFRPQTPTQYYNECLGIQVGQNNYTRALNQGLPKCPVPIFFKFSIKEVLEKHSDICEISDGNMQKSTTRKGEISTMLNRFSFDDVYSTITNTSDRKFRTYIDKSQQEFLVKDELDLSKLKSMEIIVRTEEDKKQLISLVDSNIESIIKVDKPGYPNRECFHDENKAIEHGFDGQKFSIKSEYIGNGTQSGEFWLTTSDNYEIISGKENVLYKTGNKLVFYPEIELWFDYKACFTTSFKDKVTNKPEWEIVKYCDKD